MKNADFLFWYHVFFVCPEVLLSKKKIKIRKSFTFFSIVLFEFL